MSAIPGAGTEVVLRELRLADAPRILEACSDAETSYWLGTLPSPFTSRDAETFLAVQTELRGAGKAWHWAVADPQTDALLGSVALLALADRAGPEIGYWTHPAARRRGVALAAVRAAARRAFDPPDEGGLGLRSLRLESAAGNSASRRVAERAGFTEVGTRVHGICCRDGLHDAVLYLMSCTENAEEPRQGSTGLSC